MLRERIRQRALEIGFEACGFAKAGFLETEARRLEEWLKQNRHADMSWMERNFDKRADPRLLVPNARSVISVLASYEQAAQHHYPIKKDSPKIAAYALGRDYHKVLKKKLKLLLDFIHEECGEFRARIFVDSAPVLDKAWAAKAGLGWIGKNSNLLNKQLGSFLFIGEIISEIAFPSDAPATDHCGSCTKCIEACPTDAIYEPYRVDASKCISYHTIENKNEVPEKLSEDFKNWIFGCDICQDVCPWNSKWHIASFEDLMPKPHLLALNENDLSKIDEQQYTKWFEGTPVKRAGFQNFKRNLNFMLKREQKGT